MKRNPEHESQVAVINWCRMARKDYPEAQRIFAIPNGGARHVAVAIKLKAEGVRQGVPDLCLPVPRGHLCLWRGPDLDILPFLSGCRSTEHQPVSSA